MYFFKGRFLAVKTVAFGKINVRLNLTGSKSRNNSEQYTVHFNKYSKNSKKRSIFRKSAIGTVFLKNQLVLRMIQKFRAYRFARWVFFWHIEPKTAVKLMKTICVQQVVGMYQILMAFLKRANSDNVFLNV